MNYMAEDGFPNWKHFPIAVRRIKSGRHQELNFHNHHFSEIVLILASGGSLHWAEGKSFLLRRGDVLLLHPGGVHAYQNCSSLALVNLIYRTDRLPLPLLDGVDIPLFPFLISPRCAEVLPPEKPVVTLNEETTAKVEREICELEGELNDTLPGRNLRSFTIFMNILTLLGRAGKIERKEADINPATPALTFLNMHFKESFSISHLCRISNLSRRSLFRYFHGLTGMSPGKYCRLKQLERAADLLCSSSLPLSDIASECGFADSNYFIRTFSRHFGITPGHFRKKHTEAPVQFS